MAMRMEKDLNRFHKIIRGKIKDNLREFIAKGDFSAKEGGKIVKVPLPRIEIPKFQYGSNDGQGGGGVGQGEGDVGQAVQPGDPADGGDPAASDKEGDHGLDVDVELEELAKILGETLELPRLENRGKKNIHAKSYKFSGIQNQGPESLRNFRKTFKQALKRSISEGIYNEEDPIIIPIKDDKRYRSHTLMETPMAQAVIIYMMDVSGSMGDAQKEIVRLTSFWLDTWIKSQYKGVERKFIIHDAVARDVDEKTFFHTRESGGTLISSAYKLAMKMIEEDYNPQEWNIYLFHFSDGDNWSGNDTTDCIEMLKNKMLPSCNLFGYGQVESRYGSGQFLRDLEKAFPKMPEEFVTAQIKSKDQILDCLGTFLGGKRKKAS